MRVEIERVEKECEKRRSVSRVLRVEKERFENERVEKERVERVYG